MADDSTLFKAVNNWSTTLTNAITDTDTTITLDSVAGLPTTGGVLTFTDTNEIVHYTSISENDLTVERGYDGTTATSHSAGQKVEMRWIAAHHNVLKDEIISHEGNMSNPHNVTKSQVGAIGAVEEDTTPQLGGDLDLNGHDLSGNDKITKSTKAARTIYCNASTGSDTTGDGSSGNPFATIQHAIDSLPDIISEDITIAVGANETITSPITFTGHYTSKSLTLEAMDASNNKLYDNGTATGGSATTLQDTSKTWATDFWNGGWVCIIQGTGAGEVRAITGTTSDTLTIDSGTTPDSTTDYIIVKVVIAGNSVDYGLAGMTDNLNIYGFKWASFTNYAINAAFNVSKRTGNIGLNIRYNLFDTGAHGVGIANYLDSTINSNFFQIPSGKYGIIVGYYAMDYPRFNCFKATTSGAGYGIYVYGLSLVSMYSGDTANTYINLLKGCRAAAGGIIYSGSQQVYSGCTTNYDPASASDPSYIN